MATGVLSSLQKVFKKPDPKELVRKWQTDLRMEQRKIERQIRGAQQELGSNAWTLLTACHRPYAAHSRTATFNDTLYLPDIQFEEKKVHKSIKDAAKRGDLATCKA